MRVCTPWDHPRVCGGAARFCSAASACRGPSPRVRGSPAPARRRLAPAGTIPACAGEPSTMGARRRSGRDHPRVCGGAYARRVPTYMAEGPSPRVRGSRRSRLGIGAGRGTIPACAGEPYRRQTNPLAIGDHPRVCGGAAITSAWLMTFRGPSPRVRGSLGLVAKVRQAEGTIPACAGEPCPLRISRGARRDHPRVCGGAEAGVTLIRDGRGPSPRVRGSLGGGLKRGVDVGTIPACAGEPRCRRPSARAAGDHPRVCGGARRQADCARLVAGPSPRVRGSLTTRRAIRP